MAIPFGMEVSEDETIGVKRSIGDGFALLTLEMCGGRCYLGRMTDFNFAGTSGPPNRDPMALHDNVVANFQLENSSVRGRIARLGDTTIDAVLKRHDYPRWAAHALGEALVLAVLSAATLKIDGRVLVQAEGDGPVSLLVAEARSDGGLRGYLRLNREKWDQLMVRNKDARPHPTQMIGKGVMGLVIIQDNPNTQPYQGIVPLDGATMAECAEHYFAQSEQIPTQVRLTVAEISEPGGTMRWRAGGAIIQQVAADAARGDTDEDWKPRPRPV